MSLSVAAAMVVGVGTASAVFVDYLADRALARAADAPPPVATKPLVAKALEAEAGVKVAALAPDAGAGQRPGGFAARDRSPRDPAGPESSRVAVGPEHAIELPGDDPTDSPILQFDGMAPAEDAFSVDVTVPNEEPIAADVEDDGSADETQTAAIAPDAAECRRNSRSRSRSARRPRMPSPQSSRRSPRFPASTSAGLPATHLPQTTIPAARSAR